MFFDTLQLLRSQFSLPSNRLADAISALGIEGEVTHAALSDATATAQLWLRLHEVLRFRTRLETLSDLATLAGIPPIISQSRPRNHQFFDLARAKTKVTVQYQRNESSVTNLKGILETAVLAQEIGYLTLKLGSGKRILLQTKKIIHIKAEQ